MLDYDLREVIVKEEGRGIEEGKENDNIVFNYFPSLTLSMKFLISAK